MNMIAKKIIRKTYLDGAARELRYQFMLFKRRLTRIDGRLLQNYCNKQRVKKLHIGCGNDILEDWLNSDLSPKVNSIMHLDATKRFPIESNQFDYIFSQHMIEHISHPQGLFMLNECYRILKKGGKIRISTPNLLFLIDLYRNKKTALQERYIEWSINRHIKDAPYKNAVFVINNYFRDWGHTFIYDEESLRMSLKKAGFSMIESFELHESDDPVLRNLKCQNSQDEFLRLETITLQGIK